MATQNNLFWAMLASQSFLLDDILYRYNLSCADPHSSDINGSVANRETEFGRKTSSDGYPSSQTR